MQADALEDLRAELAALGEVQDESEEAADVTAEHVDLVARIRSARAEEARLLELMASRTAALADVLAVERELARVSQSIEQLEASEHDLSARVAMAHVSVELVPVAVDFAADPLARVASSATAGLSVARALVLAMAMAIAALAPSLTLVGLIALIVRRVLRMLASTPS